MSLVRAIRAVPVTLMVELRRAQSTPTRERHREHPRLVYFHSAFFEARDPDQFVHLRGCPPPHDPGLALAISQNPRNELDLRMPWLVSVNEMTASFDRIGQAAQCLEDTGVFGKQLE